MEKDVYDLINSRDIAKYCRKINHQFNTEEIAILIHRNNSLSIDDKILAYKTLIDANEDMEIEERINCKHYDSVKDMLKEEISRIIYLKEKLSEKEANIAYMYNYCLKGPMRKYLYCKIFG